MSHQCCRHQQHTDIFDRQSVILSNPHRQTQRRSSSMPGEVVQRRNRHQAIFLIAGIIVFVIMWIMFSAESPDLEKELPTITENGQKTLYSPQKLNPDGSFKTLKGNTIITFFRPSENPAWQDALVKSQQIVKESKISDCFSILPPSSFHITTFDLFTDVMKRPAYVADVKFSKVEEEMINRLRPVFQREKEHPSMYEFTFKNVTLGPPRKTFVIELECTQREKLLKWRDEVTKVTELHLPPANFHLTLAYQRYKVPDELEAERVRIWHQLTELWHEVIKIEPIVRPSRSTLTFFRDMTHFGTTPLYEENRKLLDY